MPSSPRSVPLIEKRAEARDLAAAIKAHPADCETCSLVRSRMASKCPALTGMRAELASIREEIKHWFSPGSDQPTLL